MTTWQTARLTVLMLTDDPQAEAQTFTHFSHEPTESDIQQLAAPLTQLLDAPFEMAVLRATYQFRR